VDEANKRLALLKAKEEKQRPAAQGAPTDNELKLETKQTPQDSLLINSLLGEPENNGQSAPTNTNTTQPR
jgi:hypothetical protein